jgi:hypothetical protein
MRFFSERKVLLRTRGSSANPRFFRVRSVLSANQNLKIQKNDLIQKNLLIRKNLSIQ